MINSKSIANRLIKLLIKKIILLSLFFFLQRISYAQSLGIFIDSIYGFPPHFFSSKKQIIKENGISRCRIFMIEDESKPDSILQDTYWFDKVGNLVRSELNAKGKPYLTTNCAYDEKKRLIETSCFSEIDSTLVDKSAIRYLLDTVQTTLYINHLHGDTVYYGDIKKPIIIKGWDTVYNNRVYNKKNKLLEFKAFNTKNEMLVYNGYSFYKNGKVHKEYIDNKTTGRKYRYLFSHEFTNGEHNEFIWNDLEKELGAIKACFYDTTDKCFACKEGSSYTEFYYTKLGLLKKIKHYRNGIFAYGLKYYYD